jgi:hypothetical protein
MAQVDYIISNASGATVRADINSHLLAIVSFNSGATAPSTTYANMIWADTSVTPNLYKVRNAGDSAWKGLFSSDGELRVEAGSVATPSQSFVADADSGRSNPSANTLVDSVNGVENVRIKTTETVFNDDDNDIDFRVESVSNTHMFFVNAGTNEVGFNVSGNPAGLVHMRSSALDGGITSSNNNANELVLESSGNTGMSIFASNTGTSNIYFADQDSQNTGIIAYDHSDNTLAFQANGVQNSKLKASETIFNDAAADIDFRVEGTSEANLLFINAGDNKVGIGTASPTYELDVVGDISMNQFLYHNEDGDTYVEFTTDNINLVAGGATFIQLSEGVINDNILLNPGSADINLQLLHPGGTALVMDGATGKIGIGGSASTNMVAGDILLEGGSLVLKEITTPTADTNYGKVYTKADNKLYFQDGGGSEHELAFA